MNIFLNLLKTELKLSLRGIDMIIFAIIMPAVITIIIGILPNAPIYGGNTLLEQSIGAISSISICAGGVMGLPLLISDYRHKKILKRFHVTPVSPSVILLVHIAVYTIYSVVSLIVIYLISSGIFGIYIKGSWIKFIIIFFIVMLSIFSVGMMIGGISPNIKTASIIASLLYFPMLIFSGATLPYEIMPKALQMVSDIMPLTQGIKLLKAVFLGNQLDGLFYSWAYLLILVIVCSTVSIKFFKWE